MRSLPSLRPALLVLALAGALAAAACETVGVVLEPDWDGALPEGPDAQTLLDAGPLDAGADTGALDGSQPDAAALPDASPDAATPPDAAVPVDAGPPDAGLDASAPADAAAPGLDAAPVEPPDATAEPPDADAPPLVDAAEAMDSGL